LGNANQHLMKPHLLLLYVLLLISAGQAMAQTIRRCNNTPGITGPNIYSTIQAAHDAAANGDIIYMEASGTNYGPLVCAKRLIIYGRGYYLSTNPNGNDSQIDAEIGNVTFNNGSNNTLLSGMDVQGSITFGTSVSGITVERSYVERGILFNSTCNGAASLFANSCTIKQCFIKARGIRGSCGVPENNANRITIQNCILHTSFETCSICDEFSHFSQLNNALISNNIASSAFRVVNSTITNCLFDGGVSQTTASTFSYCFSKGANALPTGNGNRNGVDFRDLFTSNAANPNTPDTNYQLATGSPARGAGLNGTDVGPFGGPNPYVLSGQPPIPIITNLVSPPSANNNAPLNVRISVRSNN